MLPYTQSKVQRLWEEWCGKHDKGLCFSIATHCCNTLSICHPALRMSQRSISSSSKGLWHTWQWVRSGGRVCGVVAEEEREGGTSGWASWEWDWIEYMSCVHVGVVIGAHFFSTSE